MCVCLCVCSKRAPEYARESCAQGLCARARAQHAGALGGTGRVAPGWSREETAIKCFNCEQPGSPVM